MSYESRMLADLAMPGRNKAQRAQLRTLLKHGGVVKEFAAGEEVVGDLADQFELNSAQRTAALETVYRKENRLKKTERENGCLPNDASMKRCAFRTCQPQKRNRCRSNRTKSRKS